MTKQTPLTKDEMMAYELVERMKLNVSGYIGSSPYWYGWALRDAYLEGCKSYEATVWALSRQLQEANELGIAQEKRIFELQTELNALVNEAKKFMENVKTLEAVTDIALKQDDDEIESLKADVAALSQVIENYHLIEVGQVELNHKGDALIAQAASEIEELKQSNTELKDIIKSLLFIFDRDLPDNSIGRNRCDEAIALLAR